MGYTTRFKGHFTLEPALTPDQRDIVRAITKTRHAPSEPGFELKYALPDRGNDVTRLHPDTEFRLAKKTTRRGTYGGDTGCYEGAYPSIWCDWTASEDGRRLEWNGGEKFYEYEGWLRHLITNAFEPWGVRVSGWVDFAGDDPKDTGVLVVTGTRVLVVLGTVPPASMSARGCACGHCG